MKIKSFALALVAVLCVSAYADAIPPGPRAAQLRRVVAVRPQIRQNVRIVAPARVFAPQRIQFVPVGLGFGGGFGSGLGYGGGFGSSFGSFGAAPCGGVPASFGFNGLSAGSGCGCGGVPASFGFGGSFGSVGVGSGCGTGLGFGGVGLSPLGFGGGRIIRR